MAHIADLMVKPATMSGCNKYNSRESSPLPPQDRSQTPDSGVIEGKEKEKYVWRMHQQTQQPKYQLFPSTSQEKLAITPTIGRKSPELDHALAIAMATMGNTVDRPSPPSIVRLKREPSLTRRRKPSVTDLGLMATVQESAMDSPTIPGRFPVHERSISAPGEPSWRQNVFGESMICGVEGPTVDAEQRRLSRIQLQRRNSASPSNKMHSRPAKTLTPLIIPSNVNSSPEREMFPKRTLNRLSEQSVISDTPPEVPPKSARMFHEASPQSAQSASLSSAVPTSAAPTLTPFTPFTPLSAALSISTTTLSPLKVTSATITPIEGRSSPVQSALSIKTSIRVPSPMNHCRGQSESSTIVNVSRPGHRRTESEASIMDRGRPKKRSDSIKSTATKNNEQKAFETLPQGIKASDALSKLSAQDIESLKRQALGQAAQFEVLNAKDVNDLSRELRALDERCDYLRRTHQSLRSGRRNLHERICTYLRSPRVARFSHDAILKQEEALSELDTSIDDWLSKLELAENRRTRIRQKLLEHVAAALTMPSSTSGSKLDAKAVEFEPMASNSSGTTADHTPPRSPTKAPTSPQANASPVSEAPVRLARPVPPHLSMPMPSPTMAAEKVKSPRSRDSYSTIGRPSAESIRIYAGEDVYALLADVEEEIARMGAGCLEREEEEMLTTMRYDGGARSATPTGMERAKGFLRDQLRATGLVG